MSNITRKALLIGNSNVEPALAGVEKDIKRYKDYLLSNYGGAWEKEEIIISLNENTSEIILKKEELVGVDYAFVLISGHGEHRKDQTGNSETFFWFSNKHAESVKKYFPKVTRSVIVIDVCRELRVIKSLSEDHLMEYATCTASRKMSREECRKIFDNHVMSCPESRIVLYSCGIGQGAGDDGTGGIFSVALLNSFERNDRGNVINIFNAFQSAKTITVKNNYPQTPTIATGREREFFPFGIS